MGEPQRKYDFSDYIKLKKIKRATQDQTAQTKPPLSNGSTNSNELLKPGEAWDNLDKWYSRQSELPPMLSPTLPARFVHSKVSRLDLESDTEMRDSTAKDAPDSTPFKLQKIPQSDHDDIPKMLSPTLPAKYDSQQSGTPNGKSKLQKETPESQGTMQNKWNDPEERQGSRSFERIEHMGVHSYRLVKTPAEKRFLLTLHVPKYYRQKRNNVELSKSSGKSEMVGLGIRTKNDKKPKKRKASPSPEPVKKLGLSRPKGPAAMQNKDHGKLIERHKEYLEVATSMKHKGDDLAQINNKESVAHHLHCVIIYLVAFTYDDKSRAMIKKHYNDQPWVSLLTFINASIEVCSDLKYDDITGLYLQIRCAVCEHICMILEEFMASNRIRRKRADTNEALIRIDDLMMGYMESYFKYRNLARDSLRQGEQFLSIFQLTEKYPEVVRIFQKQEKSNRSEVSLSTPPSKIRSNTKLPDPVRDEFQLPICNGSSLAEITSYAFKVMKQWCKNEKIQYKQWVFE